MRSLAVRLGVTPMALYHHVSDRGALVRAMSDAVYAKLVTAFAKATGAPRRKLETLLVLYYESVVRYPELTVLIFATPGDFSSSVQDINARLSELLAEMGVARAKRRSWLEILVDFTHGSGLAAATYRHTGAAFVAAQKARYRRQLREILERLPLTKA